MQPQGDSIWGNINLCIEIALNIYYLCGEKGEGIVIPKEQAEKDFSPETVAAGKESDGYLYYPKGEAMEMFRQEMLQKRCLTSALFIVTEPSRPIWKVRIAASPHSGAWSMEDHHNGYRVVLDAASSAILEEGELYGSTPGMSVLESALWHY